MVTNHEYQKGVAVKKLVALVWLLFLLIVEISGAEQAQTEGEIYGFNPDFLVINQSSLPCKVLLMGQQESEGSKIKPGTSIVFTSFPEKRGQIFLATVELEILCYPSDLQDSVKRYTSVFTLEPGQSASLNGRNYGKIVIIPSHGEGKSILARNNNVWGWVTDLSYHPLYDIDNDCVLYILSVLIV